MELEEFPERPEAQADPDPAEELELVESCRSDLYNKTVNLIDSSMQMASLQVKSLKPSNKQLSNVKSARNIIALSDSTSDAPLIYKNSRLLNAIYRHPLVQPLWFILIFIIILNLALLSILRIKRDIMLRTWRPIFKENSTRTDKCALFDDILNADKHDFINSWLNILGDAALITTGYTALLYWFSFWCVISFYVLGVYRFSSGDIRCDYLGFLLDPLTMRRELRQQLKLVGDKVIAALNGRPPQEEIATKSSLFDNMEINSILSNQDSRFSINSGNCVIRLRAINSQGYFVKQEKEDTDRRQLTQLILSIYRTNLVRPANLTSRWHKSSLKFTHIILKYEKYNGLILGILVIVSLIVVELYMRVQQRLDTIECLNWKPNSIPIRMTVSLEDLSVEDYDAYKSSDGSLVSLIYLTLIIEAKYYLSLRRLLVISEVVLVNLILCTIWFALNVCFFFGGIRDKFKWLNQIEEQVDDCLELILKNKSSMMSQKEQVSFDINLNKSIIIAYLNYLLFKSQFGKYKIYNNFVMTQMSLLILMLMISCYTMAIKSDIFLHEIVLFTITIFIALVNYSLGLCSRMKWKITKIMKNVSKIMALHGTEGSKMTRLVMELWRSQLLDDDEIIHTYAFKIFGQYITIGKMVEFNSVFVTLWLILFFRG